jgi:hypothetical protein
MTDVDRLNDTLAVQALADVTKKWLDERGLQAYAVMIRTQGYARRQNLSLPAWATTEVPTDQEILVTPESGEASRAALRYLLDGDDPEVRDWTRAAVDKANQTQAHVIDPLSLAVGGLILGGLILASRVKKIGPDGVEFYEGIPEQLAQVLRAGANYFGSIGGP